MKNDEEKCLYFDTLNLVLAGNPLRSTNFTLSNVINYVSNMHMVHFCCSSVDFNEIVRDLGLPLVLTVSGQSDFELPLLGVGLSKRFWKLKMPSELKTNLYMIPSNERFFSNHVLRAYSLPPYKLFS